MIDSFRFNAKRVCENVTLMRKSSFIDGTGEMCLQFEHTELNAISILSMG